MKYLVLSLLILSASLTFACRQDEETNTANASPSPTVAEKKTDDFADSLASVRTGNFAYVFAFRRMDGEVFSADDKKFVKFNAPIDTNQWVLTEDGKAVIAGSNYKFMPEHLVALKKRFNVEDYSPQSADNSNANNLNGNQNSAKTQPTKSPISNSGNQNTTNKK